MRRRNSAFLPPWWAILPLSPASYWLLAHILPGVRTSNPYLHMVFASAAPALAPVFAIAFALAAAALGLARWGWRAGSAAGCWSATAAWRPGAGCAGRSLNSS